VPPAVLKKRPVLSAGSRVAQGDWRFDEKHSAGRMVAMTNTKGVFLGTMMILFAAVVYSFSLKMKPVDTYYIKILLAGLVLLSAIHLFRSLAGKGSPGPEKMSGRERFLNGKQLFLVGAILLYIALFHVEGFLVSTLLFLSTTIFILGFRKLLAVVVITASVTGLIYYIFFVYLKLYPITGILQ
jgi:hypothetical protein